MADLSLIKFEADLNAFAELLDINQKDLTQKITADLWARITGNFPSHRHPVDTGRARAGWGLSIGSPSPKSTPEGQYAAPSAPDVSAIDGTQVVYLLNNVEYIGALEDGHSKQAPNGMVRLSILEVESEIEAILQANQ